MHTGTDTTAAKAPAYAPGEVLTRTMTVRDFIQTYEPGVASLFLDPDAAYAEIEAAARAEALRLALPLSPEGVYPLIVWDTAWSNLEAYLH